MHKTTNDRVRPLVFEIKRSLMKTVRDSLSRRVRDQRNKGATVSGNRARLEGRDDVQSSICVQRRKSGAEQGRGQCAGPDQKWQNLQREKKKKKDKETDARETDANLMRVSPLDACGAPAATRQSSVRRKMYVHFKCRTQIFHFFQPSLSSTSINNEFPKDIFWGQNDLHLLCDQEADSRFLSRSNNSVNKCNSQIVLLTHPLARRLMHSAAWAAKTHGASVECLLCSQDRRQRFGQTNAIKLKSNRGNFEDS